MADKPEKKSTIKQIIQVFKFTYKEDRQLPWLCAGALIAPVAVGIVLGLIFGWSWLTWILGMIAFIMVGLLLATMTLTHRADAVGYRQLEGRMGAAIGVLSNMNKAGFMFPQEPVWIDPRTKDAVWRGTGYNGIYLPVYRICVGTGRGQTQLKDLRKTVTRQKSYVPSNHKNALMAKIHPRSRFVMSKHELAILNDRLRTLQSKGGYGVPKGIDPTKPQKISRRAMRGR